MKKFYLFIPIFILSIIAYTVLPSAVALSEDISAKVFRLHIIANSNSTNDQSLKLKVRDKVLEYTSPLYSECNSVDEAVRISKENLKGIRETAQKTISFYGYDYYARVFTTKEYFSTRKYDGFTLPAGNYYCLKIIIGEGKGKNWWCVMFPSVCISGCTDDLDKTLTPEEKALVENDKYIVKFKAIEIYEKLKNMKHK